MNIAMRESGSMTKEVDGGECHILVGIGFMLCRVLWFEDTWFKSYLYLTEKRAQIF